MEKPRFTVYRQNFADALEISTIYGMKHYNNILGDIWRAIVRCDRGVFILLLDKDSYVVSPSGRKYTFDDYRRLALAAKNMNDLAAIEELP